MWTDLVGRKGSLRRRVAGWTALVVLGTVALFALVVWLLVHGEMREALAFTPGEMGEDGREEVLIAVLIAGPIAVLAGGFAVLLVARRAFAPLDRVVDAARGMGVRDLARRLPPADRADELGDLVVALNQLFDRLERGFGALSRHAADASHELRTPIAVLVSELEVALLHPRAPDEWQRIAARALDELRRLTELVEGLLALSRIDGDLAGAPIDLGEVIRDVGGALSGQAEAAGIELEVAGDAAVVGHRGALEGALRNLVGNAIRYTPRGGRVRVSCERENGAVRVAVDDTGPGVASDERDAIFTPFARGRAAKDPGGVGLGLTIARRVAEAHKGSLAVEESPLGGARFVLQVPAA